MCEALPPTLEKRLRPMMLGTMDSWTSGVWAWFFCGVWYHDSGYNSVAAAGLWRSGHWFRWLLGSFWSRGPRSHPEGAQIVTFQGKWARGREAREPAGGRPGWLIDWWFIGTMILLILLIDWFVIYWFQWFMVPWFCWFCSSIGWWFIGTMIHGNMILLILLIDWLVIYWYHDSWYHDSADSADWLIGSRILLIAWLVIYWYHDSWYHNSADSAHWLIVDSFVHDSWYHDSVDCADSADWLIGDLLIPWFMVPWFCWFCWLIDWLIYGLIDRLIDWLVDWWID